MAAKAAQVGDWIEISIVDEKSQRVVKRAKIVAINETTPGFGHVVAEDLNGKQWCRMTSIGEQENDPNPPIWNPR